MNCVALPSERARFAPLLLGRSAGLRGGSTAECVLIVAVLDWAR